MFKSGQKISPAEAMGLCLQEAHKGLGFVSPNPPVGAVILDKNHRFLSSAHHKKCGGKHAEILALEKIKNKTLLKKGFLYVTLEPCAHFGKRPPCVDELLKYDWKTVTYGMKDPYLKTNGKGLKKLNSHGIKTELFSFYKKEIQKLYESFCFNMKYQTSYVALKIATTLDGKIALNHGKNQWVTSQASRDHVSYLRGCYDAVLIGVGTFFQDNPLLNSRKSPFKNKTNKVIVLDPKGLSLNHIEASRLAKVRPLSHIIVVVSDLVAVSKTNFHVEKRPLNFFKKQFNLKELLKDFYKNHEITSLLVEGGAEVFSSFLQQEAIQRVYQFISPQFLGSRGLSCTESLEIDVFSATKKLKEVDFFSLEKDLFLTGRF